MPNWCANALTVKGNSRDIQKFKDSEIIEVSAEDNSDEEYSDDSGHSEPIEKVICFTEEARKDPTGLDCANIKITIDKPKVFRITFDTRWEPELKWLKNLSGRYPNLKFTLAYSESGNGFYGKAVVRDGRVKDKRHEIEEGEDTQWYIVDDNGNIIREATEYDVDHEGDLKIGENLELEPVGRLKKYFDKYGIPHLGG